MYPYLVADLLWKLVVSCPPESVAAYSVGSFLLFPTHWRTASGNPERLERSMYDALISIIVPIYNVAPYLDRCVSSLVNQTYRNL
ncbi:MAG: glycosyltransferase family A protein, partial [Faecousia sp.]